MFQYAMKLTPHMAKCSIDSSVWVSFLAQDANYSKALEVFKEVKKRGYQTKIPEYIYVEIMNTLSKFHNGPKLVFLAKQLLKNENNLEIVHLDSAFLLKKLHSYYGKTKCKSADLIIIAFSIELKIKTFYTFDQQQEKNYFLLQKIL